MVIVHMSLRPSTAILKTLLNTLLVEFLKQQKGRLEKDAWPLGNIFLYNLPFCWLENSARSVLGRF